MSNFIRGGSKFWLLKSTTVLMHRYRRSSRVAWTIATHCCSASATDYFDACSRCRTLPNAWSQASVGVTTSHQCYGSCTGCQSVSASCSRSRGSYISCSVDWLPRTSQTTVAFCRTLAVAHCGPIPMTCGSCLCHEHITNSVIGVSRRWSSTVE